MTNATFTHAQACYGDKTEDGRMVITGSESALWLRSPNGETKRVPRSRLGKTVFYREVEAITTTTTDAVTEINTTTCGCTGYDYCAVCAAAEEVAQTEPTEPTEPTIHDTTIPVGDTVTVAHRNGTLDHGIVDSHIYYSGGVVWYRIRTTEGQYMDCAPEKVFSTPTTPPIENEEVWTAVACYEAGYQLTHEQKTLLLAAANDTTRRDVVIMHRLGIVTTLQEAWLAKVEGRPVAESLHGQTKKTAGRIEFRSTETVNTMLGRLVADGEEKSAVLRCGVEMYYQRKYGKALEAK